jgi:hypothetical protein
MCQVADIQVTLFQDLCRDIIELTFVTHGLLGSALNLLHELSPL